MVGEFGVILKVAEPIKSFMFDAVREYVGYIGSCEGNLAALHKSLGEVCDKKDDIRKKVKEGNDKLEEITREAASWLKDVRLLTEDEELKGLMYKDIETAKFVVKLMGKKVLKRRINEEILMQELVVKVMKKLKEEMDTSEEEMRKIVEEDYKEVAEVVVEVMKDTIDEFKKLIKEDKNMAVIATRTLKDKDLDKLTKGDLEMEEIVREAGNTSDEEFSRNFKDEESNMVPVKEPHVAVESKNTVKEAAKKLFTPLASLVTPLEKLMDDANFKKAVPQADGVKLGLEVINGLITGGRGSKEIDNDTNQNRVCCCSSLSLCNNFHGRYLISKAAECIAKHIQDELISKCPRDPVTLHIRTVDLKPIPTQFVKGLDSRTKILHQILESLNDDKVYAVGLFGMGGTGKTTLAKEVIKKIKDAFSIKVMVEVSDAPDFVRIQAAIAESIDLPLDDVKSVSQRAIRLYNRLIAEKEKKILIVFDNIWKKLNLDEVGIPPTCKILLTTRDRDVCRAMDVRDVNIIEVGLMNTNEGRELFRSHTGNQVDRREYRSVVERLLSKCGGLPLAIVATASSLKDKDLSCWEKFANDLEKPISSQISGDYRHTFTILNTSYKFIEADEKKMFFLLACLSPLGSSVSIESLMRYGIGLNLFEHVNKLSEAIEQAVAWANELMLASMLLQGDVKGDVKIHDIVRDFAISYAAKEEAHKFVVESIPRWAGDKTLKRYTAMSLTSKNDYSRLSVVEACKLQILILKGDLSTTNLDDCFFQGMGNLEVLAMSNMNFQPCLPESMRKLEKLRTLCMERCRLGNIEVVGELVNLLVLSLRESSMENIPNEVGSLCKLRLLDLTDCTTTKLPLISNGILSKLSELEGLYMYNKRQSVLENESEYEETTAVQNISLPYLNALEINLAVTQELPFDGQFVENLDKFRISVGNAYITYGSLQKFCCTLNLSNIVDVSGFLKKSYFKVFLKKADYLEMSMCRNFEDLVQQLDQDGFRSLKSLYLCFCDDIKYIVDGHKTNNLIAFPCLQSLSLMNLERLEMVYNGDVSPETFSSLQTMTLHSLHELRYGLPLVPRNVTDITVSDCKSLKFIFIEDNGLSAAELPFLKTLKLSDLPCLSSLVGPKNLSDTYDGLQGPQRFYDSKIVLPSLELFKLKGCDSIVKLWSTDIHSPGFQNLKEIEIMDCGKLSSVGSPSVLTVLVQLETLIISCCNEMHEVISLEEIEESENGEQTIVFPQLKYLRLEDLRNLESFYRGRSNLEFPKLKKLIMYKLESMKTFAKLESSSALFHEKIDFPCLEELRLIKMNDEMIGVWDKQSLTMKSNPAPMLRQLTLGSLSGLRQIPSVVLENLSSLTLDNFHFQGGNAVFSSSDLGEEGGFVWIYSQLPNLEDLKVVDSFSLPDLFEKQDPNAVNDALTLFCGQVKTLELSFLPSLNPILLQLFKSITSLSLARLKWNYLISAHLLEDSLQQLEFLKIVGCQNMEAVVSDVVTDIKLPRLKQLHLCLLECFKGFSSAPNKKAALLLPSLESLEIEMCKKMEHFWSGSIVAPRLQDLTLTDCDNLQQFLVGNPEDTIEFPSLTKVSFSSCAVFKSVSAGSLTATKLRDVQLSGCYNMQCFFPGNPNHQDSDLQLPFLEIVEIFACPKLHAFSLRRVVAPKLTQITYQLEECSMLPYDDLNHFLKEINPISS